MAGTDHQLLVGQVPMPTTRVEATFADGTEVTACPVVLPSQRAVAYAVVPMPDGGVPAGARALDAQGRAVAEVTTIDRQPGAGVPPGFAVALEARVDPELVPLPLGGVAASAPPEVQSTEVVTGDLPSGPWALAVGTDGDGFEVSLVLPDSEGSPGVLGTADQLLGADQPWNVDSRDGQHLVWGLTAPEVTTVRVTLDDGATVELATVPPGVDGLPARAFAGTLPESRHPTAIDGLDDDGTVLQHATGVVEAMPNLEAFDPASGVGLLVEDGE
jgi:hypothetical protein